LARSLKIPVTAEQRQAKKLAKLLTEDFSINLELIGHFIAYENPNIIIRRLEVVYLAAQDSYDRMIGDKEEMNQIYVDLNR
jgi:hypothetical protein